MAKDHYVSQVHIKKFMDVNNHLFYLNKNTLRISKVNSSAGIFYHEGLNVSFDENGKIDDKLLENSLNKNFENNFNVHYNKIIKCINSKDHTELLDSVKFLMQLGLVGKFRNPYYIEENRKSFFNELRPLIQCSTQDHKDSFEKMEESGLFLATDFKKLYDEISKLMGDCIYSVFLVPDGHYIFLPDCTSIVIRSEIEDTIMVDRESWTNKSYQIRAAILPINSKIILTVMSKSLCPKKTHSFSDLTSEDVDNYNKMFYQESYEKVACENKAYLEAFFIKYKMKQQ